MPPSATHAPARESVELWIDQDLAARAEKLGVDISRAAEAGIASAIADVEARQWLAENRDALESSNRYVEEHGLPLARYRMF